MKQRNIPFGYIMKNGKLLAHPTESKVVCGIFTEYHSGKSLLKIAQELTADSIEFLPSRHDWNKNRVKRILEDSRYLGNEQFPKIIEETIFQKVLDMKQSKSLTFNCQLLPVNSQLKFPVECYCNAKMARRHDKRRKASQDYWMCQNPECKQTVNMNNDMLEIEITEILNRLVSNPNLIQTNYEEQDEPLEVKRLQNDINRQLDIFAFDKEAMKASIFTLATEKYRYIDSRIVVSQMIKAESKQQALLSHFSAEFLKKVAIKIIFNEDGQVTIVLKNQQQVKSTGRLL